LWSQVILAIPEGGFIISPLVGTAVIAGLKLVPDIAALSLPHSRPKSSHVMPLSVCLDIGRVSYAIGYGLGATMKCSLQDQLQAGVDEVTARAKREKSVKSWSEHPEWALRCASRHMRGLMNAWEEDVTGNATTQWLTTPNPAVAAAVWPGDTLHWMSAEGRLLYGYLWEHTERRSAEKPFVPSNIVPGKPLPEDPVF